MKLASIYPAVLIVFLSTLFTQGCNVGEDYSTEIGKLDSTLKHTEKLVALCDSSNSVVNAQFPDSMLLMVQTIQNNYKAIMPHETAKNLAAFTHTAQELLRLGIGFSGGSEMLINYRNEISSLKKALVEHATHDKSGNEINESYVKLVMQKEQENLDQIVQHVKTLSEELKQRVVHAQENYPMIKMISDSLDNNNTGR